MLEYLYMPRLDPVMQSGKIVEWLKGEGEPVRKGEPVLIVEGEKTTFEVEAPASGVLAKVFYKPGDDVPVMSVLAIIAQPGEVIREDAIRPHEEKPEAPVRRAPEATRPAMEVSGEELKASPAARRLAREYGIDLAKVRGTGPGGRITREDVLKAIQEMPRGKTMVIPAPPKVLKVIPLTRLRRTIIERLSYSHRTAIPASLMVEANMQGAQRLKEERNISITSVIVKAVANSLRDHRDLNSTLEDDEIKVLESINVAVAIHTPEGLTAPVVHDADKKTLEEISKSIDELTERALEGRLRVEDVTGATFTVTNLGGHGIDAFVPVINPPQCAILAVGRIAERPVLKNGQLEIAPSAKLTLVFDHRIVDGVPAAAFLMKVKQYLEDPASLLG